MNPPAENPGTPARIVRLIDARVSVLTPIEARLYRDLPASWLDHVERQWAAARERAAGTDSAPIEHAHWNWRNKTDSVNSGRHRIVAVECEGDIQGVMALARAPRAAVLSPNCSIVYVDFVEAAPWNLRTVSAAPRFAGVGTALLVEAIRISREEGHEGRLGLHSLSQAEAFYARCRMTRVATDPDYYDLPYYEYTSVTALDWLSALRALQ